MKATSLYKRMQTLVQAGLISWNGQKLMPRDSSAVTKDIKVHQDNLISDLVVDGREVDYLPGHQRSDLEP